MAMPSPVATADIYKKPAVTDDGDDATHILLIEECYYCNALAF